MHTGAQLFNSLPSPAGFRSDVYVCVCPTLFLSFSFPRPSVGTRLPPLLSRLSRLFLRGTFPPRGSGVPRLPSPRFFRAFFSTLLRFLSPSFSPSRGYAARALTNFIRGTAVLATAPGLNEIIHRGARARQIIHGIARVIVIAVSRPLSPGFSIFLIFDSRSFLTLRKIIARLIERKRRYDTVSRQINRGGRAPRGIV